MNELVIKINTQIADTNIEPFAKQAKKYLSEINAVLKTDDDFAKAEQDCKDLKELENKTRTTIDEVVNGNADVESIIASAKAIAEEFRTTRLALEKLIKSEKERRKKDIIDAAVAKIKSIYDLVEDVRPMLDRSMPMQALIARIEAATKGKKSIDGIEKGVSGEGKDIAAEISQEIARLQERYKLIPQDNAHLFRDAAELVAGNNDIADVIKQRIADEEARIAEEKARIEAEAKARAEAELRAKVETEQRAKAQAESAARAQEEAELHARIAAERPAEVKENRVEPPPQTVIPPASPEQGEDFRILIHCSLEEAKTIAKHIKDTQPAAFVALKKGH